MHKRKVAGDFAGRPPGSPPRDGYFAGGAGEKTTSPSDAPLVPGEKHFFECGVCEHRADATWTGDEWLIGSFSARCPRGGDCLRAMAAELGTTAPKLKNDPLQHLAPWLLAAGRNGRRHNAEPEALPSEAVVAMCQERLLNDPTVRHVRAHLVRVRGLTAETVHRYEIGYASFHGRPRAFWQPVRDREGVLVTLIESYWPRRWIDLTGKEHKARVLAGRGSHPYPASALAADGALLVLTEGRWKAPLLNQCGFRAVTSTSSTSWDSAWSRYLVGQRVAVLYDVDAEPIAFRRVVELRAGQIDAWPVLLSRAGFTGKDGVDTALLRRGWSPDDLRAFINESRRWYRRKRRAS